MMTQEPDVQVVPKAKRRRFSAGYKRQILSEADRCSEPGQIGALLRREGLYSSHLTTWRRQREQGVLSQKRGRKLDPQAAEIKRLEQENERLRTRLSRAEHIIDVQKKLAQLLGTSPGEMPSNGS
ncbi:MAG: transposase [Caldilineaceae bacterium]|nr:transposase [Caldilineaceae bacterium]